MKKLTAWVLTLCLMFTMILPAAGLAEVQPEAEEIEEIIEAIVEAIEVPAEEVEVPEVTEAPAEETEVPEVTEAPAEETEVPEVTEAPVEETEAPEVTEAPAEETEAPEVTEVPAEETEAPEVTEAPVEETEVPEETEAPAEETDEPVVMSAEEQAYFDVAESVLARLDRMSLPTGPAPAAASKDIAAYFPGSSTLNMTMPAGWYKYGDSTQSGYSMTAWTNGTMLLGLTTYNSYYSLDTIYSVMRNNYTDAYTGTVSGITYVCGYGMKSTASNSYAQMCQFNYAGKTYAVAGTKMTMSQVLIMDNIFKTLNVTSDTPTPTPTTPSVTVGSIASVAGSPVDTNAARITWSAAENANGYQLYRAASETGTYSWIKNVPDTAVNNYSLTPGADYWYKVRPYREAADGSRVYGQYSDAVHVHILGKINHLTVRGLDTNAAKLTWDKVPGCTGYQVFRTEAGTGGNYQWVKNCSTAQIGNYSLKPGTTYYYKLRAYIDLPDGKRAYGQYSEAVSVDIQGTINNLQLTTSGTSISGTWDVIDHCTGYQVFYKQEGVGDSYTWYKNVATPAFTLNNLVPGAKYYIQLRSYRDEADGARSYGQFLYGSNITVQAQPKYRALLIGQGYDYWNDGGLPGSKNDAVGMRSMLAGVKESYDVTVKNNQTRAQMLSSIQTAFAGSTAEDTILFFYSGHGSDGGYLCGTDAEYSSSGYLHVNQLRAALDAIPAKNKIVIIDACFSGDLIGKSRDDVYAKQVSFNSEVISAFSSYDKANLAANPYYVLTAASGYETSSEGTIYSGGYSKRVGFFAYYLCYGCGYDYVPNKTTGYYADTNSDKKLTLKELYTYTYNRAVTYDQHAQVYPANSSFVLFTY